MAEKDSSTAIGVGIFAAIIVFALSASQGIVIGVVAGVFAGIAGFVLTAAIKDS